MATSSQVMSASQSTCHTAWSLTACTLAPAARRTEFDTSHIIDKLSFGVEYPGMKNPLDVTRVSRHNIRNPEGRTGAYQYFLKVEAQFYIFCSPLTAWETRGWLV